MGHGNSALVIADDYGRDVYFLLFSDKVPAQFRPIVATHEFTEYDLVSEQGLDQRLAHLKAYNVELATAERLGIKESYLEYLKEQYPTKYEELRGPDGVR